MKVKEELSKTSERKTTDNDQSRSALELCPQVTPHPSLTPVPFHWPGGGGFKVAGAPTHSESLTLIFTVTLSRKKPLSVPVVSEDGWLGPAQSIRKYVYLMRTWSEAPAPRLRKVHINGTPIQRVKAETPCLLWRIPWFPPDCSNRFETPMFSSVCHVSHPYCVLALNTSKHFFLHTLWTTVFFLSQPVNLRLRQVGFVFFPFMFICRI